MRKQSKGHADNSGEVRRRGKPAMPPGSRSPSGRKNQRRVKRPRCRIARQWSVGIGGFAERRVRVALPAFTGRIGGMPHLSPANPLANRNWAEQADAALRKAGVA
jgi:single-strand selective monofunctional uracil DNA glycosylase